MIPDGLKERGGGLGPDTLPTSSFPGLLAERESGPSSTAFPVSNFQNLASPGRRDLPGKEGGDGYVKPLVTTRLALAGAELIPGRRGGLLLGKWGQDRQKGPRWPWAQGPPSLSGPQSLPVLRAGRGQECRATEISGGQES